MLVALAAVLAAATTVRNEQPAGVPDGARQFFTLKHRPVDKWTVELYRNGLRQFNGADFLVDVPGSRIGFLPCCIPQTGDLLLADYDY